MTKRSDAFDKLLPPTADAVDRAIQLLEKALSLIDEHDLSNVAVNYVDHGLSLLKAERDHRIAKKRPISSK